MGAFIFLTDEWFDEVAGVLALHGTAAAPDGADVIVNVEVTAVPDSGTRTFHMGARENQPIWGQGHHETAEMAVVVDFETARSVLIGGDQQAALSAFLSGKVRLQGDMTRLMFLTQAGGMVGNPEVIAAIQAITD